MTRDEACQVLGVVWRPTPEAVKTAWRTLIMQTHPDHGGEAGDFQRVHVAYRTLTEELTREEVCDTCHGRKTVTHTSGFHQVEWPCHSCHGAGTAPRP